LLPPSIVVNGNKWLYQRLRNSEWQSRKRGSNGFAGTWWFWRNDARNGRKLLVLLLETGGCGGAMRVVESITAAAAVTTLNTAVCRQTGRVSMKIQDRNIVFKRRIEKDDFGNINGGFAVGTGARRSANNAVIALLDLFVFPFRELICLEPIPLRLQLVGRPVDKMIVSKQRRELLGEAATDESYKGVLTSLLSLSFFALGVVLYTCLVFW